MTSPILSVGDGWFDIGYASALICFLFVCFFQTMDVSADYPLEIIAVTINGFLSIVGQIMALRRRAALHFVSFVFTYLFLSAAPLVQIGVELDPIFRMGSYALIASVSSMAFILMGVFYTRRIKPVDAAPPSHTGGSYFLLLLMTGTISALAIFLFKDTLFTSRETFGNSLSQYFDDMPTTLLALTFLQSLPFFGATIGLRAALEERRKVWVVLYGGLLLAASLLNNPMIQPRFKIAGLAFFFIDYFFRGRRIRLLALLLVVGVGVAPAMNAFRQDVAGMPSSEHEGLFEKTFLSYDYDAFITASYSALQVAQAGPSYGSNLLGAALFFVPHTFWADKPIQTSLIIFKVMSKYRSVGTNNLSTPLMAEGYYAFGTLGALGLSWLYWVGIGFMTSRSNGHEETMMFLQRSVCVGLVLIFLRGTLIVGVAAVAGSMVASLLPYIVFRNRFIRL